MGPETGMVAIFGLGITRIENRPPKIRPSKTKKGIEINQRRNNLFVDPKLNIIIFPLTGYLI